jgi:hypothetical protein
LYQPPCRGHPPCNEEVYFFFILFSAASASFLRFAALSLLLPPELAERVRLLVVVNSAGNVVWLPLSLVRPRLPLLTVPLLLSLARPRLLLLTVPLVLVIVELSKSVS